jgi:peptidoglycan hydrolase CwlO-like protein
VTVVIITGMHRSGTSLVTSLLQRAGVDVGSQLLGPARGNPRGHFEDLDFLDFHQELLRRSGLGMLVRHEDLTPELRPEDEARANELVAARRDRELWGWKDPRTSLFLDFWARLLPEARFLFVYRHPLEVVLSLLRRGTDAEVLADPLIGLRSWRVYNRKIFDFLERHPERHLLANVHRIMAEPQHFLALARERLGLPLDDAGTEGLIHREELNRRTYPPEVETILRRIDPATLDLRRQLEGRADFPAPPTDDATAEPPTPVAASDLDLVSRLLDRRGTHPSLVRAAFCWMLAALDPETLSTRETALLQHLDQIDSLGRQLTHRETNLKDLRTHAENLERELEERDRRIENFQRRSETLDEELERRGRQIEELVGQLEATQDRHHQLDAEARRLRDDLGARESQLDELRRREEASQAEIRELRERAERRGPEAEVRDRRIAELEEHAENLETRIAELSTHARNLESLVEQRNRRAIGLEEHTQNLEIIVQQQRGRIADLSAHAENLERLVAELRDRSEG